MGDSGGRPGDGRRVFVRWGHGAHAAIHCPPLRKCFPKRAALFLSYSVVGGTRVTGMESRVKPQDVAIRHKTMKLLEKIAEKLPAEVFRLMEWVIIIAAVLVADERLKSQWLQWLAFALSMLLVMRVNWFLSDALKHPEEMQPDGSLVVKFKLWMSLVGLLVAGFAYYLAFGVSALFAESELAERDRTPQATVAPNAAPRAASQTTPKAEPQVSQQVPTKTPQDALQGAREEGGAIRAGAGEIAAEAEADVAPMPPNDAPKNLPSPSGRN